MQPGSGGQLPTIDVREAERRRRDASPRPVVVDVREPNEYQINRIEGSTLIPLGEIPRRYQELNPDEEIVVQCKVGGRSAKAADFLRSVGFKRGRWVDSVIMQRPLGAGDATRP
jgi:adenylyltransferase/sulfurtransferase